MQWRAQAGQGAVEAVAIVSLVVVLLLTIFCAGYAAAGRLLVVASASQGAHRGALLCLDGASSDAVVAAARQTALDGLAPLNGPKEATAGLDGSDLVVTSTYTFQPPLPGGQALVGDNVRFQSTARERCL